MIKICAFCGNLFDAKTANQKYCGKSCYRKAQKDLEIEREYERRISKRGELVSHTYKLWNPKDPECVETYRFMRTIKPLNWGEIL